MEDNKPLSTIEIAGMVAFHIQKMYADDKEFNQDLRPLKRIEEYYCEYLKSVYNKPKWENQLKELINDNKGKVIKFLKEKDETLFNEFGELSKWYKDDDEEEH